MYKWSVKKIALTLVVLLASVCVIIGASHKVLAKTSESVLMNKTLANGILRCYSSDYMKNGKNGNILAADVSGVSALIVGNYDTFSSGSGGFKDGTIKVPSKYGNTLKDDDISCYQLFNGWKGLSSGSIDGLLKNVQLKGSDLLTKMGYVETADGGDSICVAYEYYLKGGSFKTNKLCYEVKDGKIASNRWTSNNDEKKGAFYLASNQYDPNTIEIWSSDMDENCTTVQVGYTCSNPGVYTVKNGMTVDEFKVAVSNGGSAFDDATWNADSWFNGDHSGSKLKNVEIGSNNIYKRWVINEWSEAANVAINNLTIYSNEDEIRFTTQEKYDLYMGYLLGNNSVYELYAIGDRCTDNKDGSNDSVPFVVGSDIKWCELGGDFSSDKKVNIFASGNDRYLDESVGVRGVIAALRNLDLDGIDLTTVDTTTGNMDQTVDNDSSLTGDGDNNVCYANSGALGWLICPVVTMLTPIGEHMWNKIEQNMKVPTPEMFRDGGGVQTAWGAMRDIANVLFAGLFLFIIFSQLTGVGIDNYGIKKIMPKLIVVAVLINLSYLICRLGVELSNIFGVGLNSILSDSAAGLAGAEMSVGDKVISWSLGALLGAGAGGLFVLFSGGTIALAAVSLGLMVLGFLISLIFSMLFLYLTLIVREAGIILAVVVAPVALACYMLPNTEKWFKKWWEIFKALLVVYPLCGALVGAGQLAGAVLSSVPGMGVPAMLVQVLPFFLVPTLLRNSLDSLGKVGARLSNLGKDWGKKTSGVLQSGIKNDSRYKDWSQYQLDKASLARSERIRNRLGRRRVSSLSAMERSQWASASHRVAVAENQKEKEYGEIFDRYERPQVQAEFASAINGKDAEMASAALTTLLQKGGIDEALTIMDRANWSRMDAGVRTRLLQTMGGTNVDAMKSFAKYRQTGGQAEFKDWSRGVDSAGSTVLANEAANAAAAARKKESGAALTDAERAALAVKDRTFALHLLENGEHAMDSYSKDEMQFIGGRSSELILQMTPQNFGKALGSMAMNSKDAKAQTEAEGIIQKEIKNKLKNNLANRVSGISVSDLGITAESIGRMRGDFARALEAGYGEARRADLRVALASQIAAASADGRISNRTDADVKVIFGMREQQQQGTQEQQQQGMQQQQ